MSKVYASNLNNIRYPKHYTKHDAKAKIAASYTNYKHALPQTGDTNYTITGVIVALLSVALLGISLDDKRKRN